jgi:hypothetical protein
MAFLAKYEGECNRCGQAIERGQSIERRRRGYQHSGCSKTSEAPRSAELRRMDSEVAAGESDYRRWKENTQMFGEDYAVAEELAWSMKTGEGW